MKKTILVCGLGPGISAAVARNFGPAGFAVALVARSAGRLEAAAAGLVKGTAFDSGEAKLEPAAIAEKFFEIYSARSPISVVFG